MASDLPSDKDLDVPLHCAKRSAPHDLPSDSDDLPSDDESAEPFITPSIASRSAPHLGRISSRVSSSTWYFPDVTATLRQEQKLVFEELSLGLLQSTEREDVIEVFSVPRVTPICAKLGLQASIAYDIALGCDLSTSAARMGLWRDVLRKKPRVTSWHIDKIKNQPLDSLHRSSTSSVSKFPIP